MQGYILNNIYHTCEISNRIEICLGYVGGRFGSGLKKRKYNIRRVIMGA